MIQIRIANLNLSVPKNPDMIQEAIDILKGYKKYLEQKEVVEHGRGK